MSAQFRHYINILKESEKIMKKLERSSVNPESLPDYKEVITLRNTAYIELLKKGAPFIALTDSDELIINIDETNYAINKTYLRQVLGNEEYSKLLNSSTFNPDVLKQLEESENVQDTRKMDFQERLERLEKQLEMSNEFNQAIQETPSFEQSTTNSSIPLEHDSDLHNNSSTKQETKEIPTIDYRINKHGMAKLVSTTEFAFMGVSAGAGTTFSAIMFAQALSTQPNCDVAYFEANNSGQMRQFSEWITNETIDNMFPLNGVDFYYDMDYLTFAAKYKDSYDCVVIDFGTYNEELDISDFVRISGKFVVANGIDWKLPKLDSFCNNYHHGETRTITFLIPLLSEDSLGYIKSITAPNRTVIVPYNNNPFEPDEETISLFKSLIGMESIEEKKSMFSNILNLLPKR